MAWIDLHEGILEDFAGRHYADPYAFAAEAGLHVDHLAPSDRWDAWIAKHLSADDVRRMKREWAKARRANMTPEQRAADNEKAANRYRFLSKEQRQAYVERASAQQRARRSDPVMGEQIRAKGRERNRAIRASMTPERREEVRAYKRAWYAAKRGAK